MSVVGPTGFHCWISFTPVFSCILLSPYLCFVSFLYLNLYFLGYDTSIIRDLSSDPNIYLSLSTSEISLMLVP